MGLRAIYRHNNIIQPSITSSVTTDAVDEPVPTSEVLNWLRVQHVSSDEEGLIASLAKECRQLVEQYIRVDIASKTRRFQVKGHNSGVDIRLPYGPHGDELTLSQEGDNQNLTVNADYRVFGLDFKTLVLLDTLVRSGWYERLNIECLSGYNASTIPHDIKLALKQVIVNAYEYRGEQSESIVSIPNSAKEILRKHRRVYV